MEIKEVSNEAITGESLLSMIEENVSENKKAKKSDSEDISEEEIMEDDELDVQEVDYDDDMDEDDDDDMDEDDDSVDSDDDKKKGGIGKKEILMFVALGVSIVVMGAVIYMMLFAEEEDTFDAVAPMPTQKVAPKPVQPIQQVKPIAQQQVQHQNSQFDKNSGEPEPLKLINQNLQQQQQVVVQPAQPQPKPQAVENNVKIMGNELDEIQEVEQKQEVAKPKTIHFVAKSKEDVGINQFAVIGNKAYLSSDLFEKTEFDVEDKEYSAKFNGKTRSFLKVIGEDSVYLPAKQVSDNYTVGK